MSSECDFSIVPLFGDVPKNEEILGKYMDRIACTNSGDTKHIKFEIKGNEDYINLQKTSLYFKAKIVKSDGTNLDNNAEVAFINYPGSTLFSKVDVSIGDANDNVLSHEYYGYISYLQTLLTFDNCAKDTWLTGGLFYKDTPGKMDAYSQDNQGFVKRKNLTAQSVYVECEVPIHSGFFQQPKPLKNRIDFTIEFTKQDDDFCIMADVANKYKIEILEPTLIIERLQLSSKLITIYESQLMKQNIKYSIERCKIWVKDQSDGIEQLTLRNFTDENELPKKIIFGMVSELAFSGRQNLNPMNFKNYNLSSFNLTVNGRSFYGEPLSMNFGAKQCIQPYIHTMRSLGFFGKKDGCSLSKEEFINGCSLFAIDLAPTSCGLNLIDPVQTGILTIDLHFSTPTPEKFKTIIYMEFESHFSINSSNRVIKLYT